MVFLQSQSSHCNFFRTELLESLPSRPSSTTSLLLCTSCIGCLWTDAYNSRSFFSCYKCLNGLAPPYLSELLSRYVPARSLRSADKDLLTVPSISAKALKTFGSRSFTLAGPRLWNDLPREIRGSGSLEIFKKRLKTHLFKLAYE